MLSERFVKYSSSGSLSPSTVRMYPHSPLAHNLTCSSRVPKLPNLSQGTFVGAVSDNFWRKIDQKIFHAETIVDDAKVGAEEKAYRKIPVINELKDKDGNDIMMQQIQLNYDQIKLDAQAIINEEMNRIKNYLMMQAIGVG